MRFAPQQVDVERRADGTILLRSPQKLGSYARCVTQWLSDWSDRAPDKVFLAERTAAGDYSTPQELGARISDEVRKWAQVAKDAGAKVE